MTAAMFFTQVLRQTRVAIAERHCRGAGGDTTPRLQGAGGYRSTAANVADAANCSSTHAGEEGIGITQGSRDLASRGEDTRRQRLSTHSALALPTAAADMRGEVTVADPHTLHTCPYRSRVMQHLCVGLCSYLSCPSSLV